MDKRWFNTLSLYVVLGLAATPLALGWVPPNRWYGFRFPGALFAPELWYRINTLGGQMFIVGLGVCALLNGLALWLAPKAWQPLLPWLGAALIGINFWLVTTELLTRLPS